jgi:FkbM family methyltransferase
MSPLNQSGSAAAMARAEAGAVTLSLTEFDQRHYLKLIQARGQTMRSVVMQMRQNFGLHTAVDVGCGIGFFAQILHECGMNVCGFDGRAENIAEARRRFPAIPFEQGDIESADILKLGTFHLTLCFGLLYHLENPMLAIRHLRALTTNALLLESMCIPGRDAGMVLRDEPVAADQSLTDIALYPSEACLVKMLYRAGFATVYRVANLPDHDDFRETAEHARRRTVLFASVEAVRLPGFVEMAEPRDRLDPWSKPESRTARATLAHRLWRFVRAPRKTQYFAAMNRVRQIFPQTPIPLRLPFGAWWLAQDSALDHELMHGTFEHAERLFVRKFLRTGMIVVDVGAHHGLYTLLAAKCVGRRGKVIAFEPSRRERLRLLQHVRVNGCANVTVQACALGDKSGKADLFMADGAQDWCNSLRPPAVSEQTATTSVSVERLDDALWRLQVGAVDFIKLDAEGAELSVLQGAGELLRGTSRPVILAEVEDIRTKPWGYRAREIVEFLANQKYCWFALSAGGSLRLADTAADSYDANLVALPAERVDEIQKRVSRRV